MRSVCGVVVGKEDGRRPGSQLVGDIEMGSPFDLHIQVVAAGQFGVTDRDGIPRETIGPALGEGGGLCEFLIGFSVFVALDLQQVGKLPEIIHDAKIGAGWEGMDFSVIFSR